MAGGDYNQGVSGCGIATAHALARCGFGDALLTAAQTLHGSNLENFLDTWCDSLRLELSTNSQGFLCRRERTLASSLPDNFPDVNILSLYVTPATSWSRGLGDVVSTEALDWKPREPTIGLIASFCLQYLGWHDLHQMVDVFEDHVWGGIVCRMLCSVCVYSTLLISTLHSLYTLSLIFFMTAHMVISQHPRRSFASSKLPRALGLTNRRLSPSPISR